MGLAVAISAGIAPAWAQDDSTARANRTAYEWAQKCYILLGKAESDRERAGDKAKAAFYDAKARHAFDLVYAAGNALGLSDAQVERDLTFTQTKELPSLVSDDSYFRSTASSCKAVGLL